MRLKQSEAQLVALIKDIEAKPYDVDCATNAQWVLSNILGKQIERPTMVAGNVKFLGKTNRR